MTAPLDEKGLEAAIDVACRNAGHDPNACMFGSGGTSVGSECHVNYREAHRAGTAQAIRAYLSAVALPDELLERLRNRAYAAEQECRTDDADLFSQAHSTIAALRAEIGGLKDELEEARAGTWRAGNK